MLFYIVRSKLHPDTILYGEDMNFSNVVVAFVNTPGNSIVGNDVITTNSAENVFVFPYNI